MRNYCCLHGFGMTSKRYCSVKRSKGKSILHEPVQSWRIRARDFWKDFGAGGWGGLGKGLEQENWRVQRPGHRSEVGQRILPLVYFLLPKCLSSAVKDLPVSGWLVGWLVDRWVDGWVSICGPRTLCIRGKHSDPQGLWISFSSLKKSHGDDGEYSPLLKVNWLWL